MLRRRLCSVARRRHSPSLLLASRQTRAIAAARSNQQSQQHLQSSAFCTSFGRTSSIVSRTNSALHCSARSMSAAAAAAPNANSQAPEEFIFGHVKLHPSQVFASNSLAYASVNLKPVVQGHALVMSRRKVERVKDLTDSELTAMWSMARDVARALEPHFRAAAFTFAIQDGADAGQTVKHVHIHVMPRRPGDFEPNDQIYHKLEEESKRVAAAAAKAASTDSAAAKPHVHTHARMDVPDDRKARTSEEMAAEAKLFRSLMEELAKRNQQAVPDR